MLNGLESMRSWAMPIKDRQKIPEFFQKDFTAQFGSGELPYILFNPSQRLDKDGNDEKLLCLAADRLVIFSRTDSPFVCKFADIIYWVHSELLLAYSISIYTANSEAHLAYNSACSDLFIPVIASLRPVPVSAEEHINDRDKLAPLADIDLKFMNYGRQIIAGSGHLIDYTFQEILKEEAGRLSSKTLIESHLLLLTDNELIWLANEKKDWAKEPVYGGIFTFIKPANILSIQTNAADENGVFQMTILLKGDKQLQIPYQDQNIESVKRIQEAILKLVG
jgi:hypothetical protein